MDGIYRFLVRGHLDNRWSPWFGGLAIDRTEDGCTVLTGSLLDQAALHGVIARIRDLGLPLLAVESERQGRCAAHCLLPARGSPDRSNDRPSSPADPDVSSIEPFIPDGGPSCD